MARTSCTRLGRSALALTLLLAAVLAALGALAWFVTRESGAREAEKAQQPTVERPREPQVEVAADAPATEVRAPEHGAAGPGPATVAPAPAPGTLHLLVRDAATHAPVPELGFVVYRERGGMKELAQGRTDAQGCARIEGLAPDTILVRTERKPPWAATSAGVQLAAGSTQELEIEVGPGSTITGRVVDDRKLPVRDAAIFLGAREARTRAAEPLTRSAADGRFRIECASSHPSGIAIVDGGLRAEKSEGEVVRISRDDVEVSVTAEIEEGKDTDLGDVELSRATIFAGRVVDPHGVPVEGALVSPYKERMLARGGALSASIRDEFRVPLADAAFHLLPDEQLTGAAGRFELRGNPKGRAVVVETRAGLLQDFVLPAAVPGERKEEIELKLDPMTLLAIELVDARGERIRGPAASPLADGLSTPWRSGHLAPDAGLYVLSLEKGGLTMTGLPATCDADGLWRVQVRKEPERIDELRVILSGYQPIADKVAGKLHVRTELHYELAPFPLFHLRLRASDPAARLLDPPGVALQIHVCLADPEHHASAHAGVCCGFGVFWNGTWRGEARALVLPVRRKAAFWIYARVPAPGGTPRDFAHVGPFEPGEESRELALDPAELSAAAAELAAERDPGVPLGDSRAQLAARIVDQDTLKGIPGATLHLAEALGSSRRVAGAGAVADEHGLLKHVHAPAGTWEIRALAQGYRSALVGVQAITRDTQLDLGTIALAPAPVHRGRVLGGDGQPLAKIYLELVRDAPPDPPERLSGPTGADGAFQLFGELPPNLVLSLGRRVEGAPAVRYEFQRLALHAWPDKKVQDVPFRPARQVVVTLYGLDPDEAELIPKVCPALGEPTCFCDHRSPVPAEHIPLERGFELDWRNTPPRYAFLLAPGRYQVWGTNMLHYLPLTEVDVALGPGDLELPIVAR